MRQGLEELAVYQLAMEIGELIWDVVMRWDSFAKSAVGDNFVRAADSVAYNISEGYGRHFFKENRNFCWIARGSLSETKTGVQKAFNRKLISEAEYKTLMEKINVCYPKLNNYIAYIEKQIPGQKEG
jgi:four helix bundle protein